MPYSHWLALMKNFFQERALNQAVFYGIKTYGTFYREKESFLKLFRSVVEYNS